MSDTLILDAVKAFLKPIIAEAIHEAGTVTDTETIAAPVAPPATEDASTKPKLDENGNPDPDQYYTVDEVKAILRIGTTSVYNLFKRKKLTKMKVLGKTVVRKEELDNAVEAQTVARYSHRK